MRGASVRDDERGEVSAQIGFDFSAPGKQSRAPKIAKPHLEARAAGVADGIAGERRSAERWPSGAYGHADYELGYAEGEGSRG